MKPATVHVIKSVRIAKARMGKAVQEPERPESSAKKQRRSYTRRSPSKPGRKKMEKKEGSHSTTCSVSKPRGRRAAKDPLALAESTSHSESLEGSHLYLRPENPAQGERGEATKFKRVKQARMLKLSDDGRFFSADEIQIFENLYGDKLFDNTIDTSPATQADLSVLTRRAFRSYRPEKAGPLAGVLPTLDASVVAEVRRWLDLHGFLEVTDSQILRLAFYFPSTKGLLTFLRLEPEVLTAYFEKIRTIGRRRGWR